MNAFLRHVLQAAYLYAENDIPLGAWPAGASWWISGLGLGLLLGALLWRRQRESWSARLITLGSAAALVAYLVRPWVTGPFSARIWTYAWSVSVLGLWLVWGVRHLGWGRLLCAQVDALALALDPADPPASPWWLTLHAVGLALLGAQGHGGLAAGVAALSLGLVAIAQCSYDGRWSGRCLRPELLSPLYLAYGSGLLWYLLVDRLDVAPAPYAAFPYAEPFALIVDTDAILALVCLWLVLVMTAYICRVKRWPMERALAVLATLVLVSSIGWYGAVVSRHLSHGASGSDPFCYLQMAADLAEQGSFAHYFPLAEMARTVHVPAWPIVSVGYHLPDDTSLAVTVWPTGWPLLLSPLYALGGEFLALWGAPLWHLLGAVLTYTLVCTVLRDSTRAERHLWAVLAAALTLTSQEAILRSLVPMADAAAAALTVATMLALHWARVSRRLLWDITAGIYLGLAYWVRHPLLPLAAAAIPMLCRKYPQRWAHLSAFGGVALIVALPDLAYHARWFGSPWVAESPEWFLISWRNVPSTFAALVRDGWLRRSEFGALWLFVAAGTWALWCVKESRALASSLVGSFLAMLGFSLCYQALRWRDLLALVPVLSLWASVGLAWLWRGTQRGSSQNLRRAGLLLVLLFSLVMRGSESVGLPWAQSVAVFGHVSQQQRAAYNTLSHLVPPKAIVATGLGAGAVSRYAGRETVRPDSWTREELARFLGRARRAGYPLYLLDDGETMACLVVDDDLPGRLERLGELSLPTFGLGGEVLGRPATLYRWDAP